MSKRDTGALDKIIEHPVRLGSLIIGVSLFMGVTRHVWRIMLGKTHVAVGVAAALVVLQPISVGQCMCAVAGGALGGMICDIDGNWGTENPEYPVADALFFAIVLALAALFDWLFGDGLCDWIASHVSLLVVPPAIAMAALLAFGRASGHRSFMHSLAGCAAFTTCVYFLAEPIAWAFALGYLSHLALDLLNKSGEQLFWPLKIRLCLKFFPANGRANDVALAISIVVSVCMLPYLLVGAAGSSDFFAGLVASSGHGGVVPSPFTVYLVTINIVAFAAFTLDFFVFSSGKVDYVNDGGTASFLSLFALIGGGLGMLLAVMVWNWGSLLEGIGWIALALCSAILWGCFYLAVCNPELLPFRGFASFDPLGYMSLWVALALLNALCAGLFLRDKNKKPRGFRAYDLLLSAVSFIGGATGGYVAMILGRTKLATYYATLMPIFVLFNWACVFLAIAFELV